MPENDAHTYATGCSCSEGSNKVQSIHVVIKERAVDLEDLVDGVTYHTSARLGRSPMKAHPGPYPRCR